MLFAEALKCQQVTQSTVGGNLQVAVVGDVRCFKQSGDIHGVAILTMTGTWSNDSISLARFSKPLLCDEYGCYTINYLLIDSAAQSKCAPRLQQLTSF